MRLLGSRTSPEVTELAARTERSEHADRSNLTLVIPLGSTEQHGAHLPLDTDTRIAEAVAGRVVEALDDTILGPTIALGASGEHAGFAGTLSIGTDSLAQMLIELVRGAGPEFARVVVVNGHGGNIDALTRASRVCRSEGRNLCAWSATVSGADAHAGRTETSLMLSISPDQVRVDRATAGVTDPLERLLPRLRNEGLQGVTPNGVLGNPSGASAEEGECLLADLVADAVESLSGHPSGGDRPDNPQR